MALTKIEWTATPDADGTLQPGYTFNMWRGCQKVSGGCKNCYAETLSKRNPAVLGEWGPNGKRAIAAESYWKLPEQWDRAAEKAGVRRKVFCASLADVFEDREELHLPRLRLLDIIARTPHLDWLLLTKRPENVMPALRVAAETFRAKWQGLRFRADAGIYLAGRWVNYRMAPKNVWLGTSCENQETADERIPWLIETPAAVRFLSCEPLLGPIDLYECCAIPQEVRHDPHGHMVRIASGVPGVHWVIAGGESGPNARPCHPDWLRGLRDQCVDNGIAYFFKQWGAWGPGEGRPVAQKNAAKSIMFSSDGSIYDGEDPASILAFARSHPSTFPMYRWGKKEAGRKLYSEEWSQFPTPRTEVASGAV